MFVVYFYVCCVFLCLLCISIAIFALCILFLCKFYVLLNFTFYLFDKFNVCKLVIFNASSQK